MIRFGDTDGNRLDETQEAEIRKNIKKIHISFKGIADARYGESDSNYRTETSNELYIEPNNFKRNPTK